MGNSLRYLLVLLSFVGVTSWAQTPATEKAPAPKVTAEKKLEKAKPVEDTESDFYDEQDTPPAEEMPTDDPASEDKDSGFVTPEGPVDDGYEANENPDDSGIEYAEDAEKREAELQKKRLEEKRAKTAPRPAIDEPLPLIRRQRELKELTSKQQPTRIRHPYAAKGLTKITKDKVYIYRVKESDQKTASTIHIGTFSPTKLENPDTHFVFEDFYETGNPAILYDYEWQVSSRLGKAGLKLGTGLAMASGNGRFKNDYNGEIEPKEKFTFVVFPNTLGAIVRLQFMKNQIFVPYAEGGGAAFVFGEFRDDGKMPKAGGALGAYFAGGVAFSLNFLDPVSMLELDREYSINSVYLTAEYRQYVGFGNFDFTSEVINGGMTLEF